MNCTRCKGVICEGEMSWDFGDAVFCQECWEKHCAETWAKTGWGNYEPVG